MSKLRVTVLCGGPSSEREVSLRSGRQILGFLNPEKYESRILELSNEPDLIYLSLQDAKVSTDIAFIALHGRFGEDGKIQAMLDSLRIPYTGSGVMASALGMNKMKSMDIARLAGIRVPTFFSIPDLFPLPLAEQTIQGSFGYPCVVKPNESGSSLGVTIVRDSTGLGLALQKAFIEDRAVIIQRYIAGRELTCGVLGNSHEGTLTALPPIEIIPGQTFFDYEAKYQSANTREICPAEIPDELEKEVQDASKKIHELLSCGGLTRSDFIYGDDSKLYLLEINTIPGMTEASLCPKEAKALGWSFGEFLDQIIDLAAKRYKLKI